MESKIFIGRMFTKTYCFRRYPIYKTVDNTQLIFFQFYISQVLFLGKLHIGSVVVLGCFILLKIQELKYIICVLQGTR